MSEDCLFVDVFAPASTTKNSNLPVYVFIQGGGFNENANANLDGKGLVKASGMGIVVVTFNYRVGPFGFLASSEVKKNASLNNGLKDQRQLLHWCQNHIREVGTVFEARIHLPNISNSLEETRIMLFWVELALARLPSHCN